MTLEAGGDGKEAPVSHHGRPWRGRADVVNPGSRRWILWQEGQNGRQMLSQNGDEAPGRTSLVSIRIDNNHGP